jgi:putative alpha-1,2-mannosidase
MTTTNHTALYRFTFPAAGNRSSSPLILADTIDLPLSRINATSSVDSDTGRITGSGTFVPSFGLGTYDLHFCADFEGAFIRDTGVSSPTFRNVVSNVLTRLLKVFVNTRGGSQPKTVTTTPDGSDSGTSQNPVGTWVWFDQPSNGQILARVGVSFMSVDQACSNAEKEIPNFDFHKIRTAAREAWVEKLGVISILPGGASKSLLKVFWSGFYRSLLSPQDYTGENPLWKSTEPYWDR